ncbi:rab proteins geranylgeranyltransferase component A 2-like [Oscarella lobularis]|uniref:rab proteins geranylgeranyltransferase component A 2-like n=1 Tax=Oscarella lobularis TaxID=121494 RepID=UPI003313BD0F
MGDDLPDEYDSIVLGTGLVEAIVAAALARSGRKVLHLDSNGYYGGNWAVFNWKDLEEWIASVKSSGNSDSAPDERDYSDLLKDGERLLSMSKPLVTVSDLDVEEILVPETETDRSQANTEIKHETEEETVNEENESAVADTTETLKNEEEGEERGRETKDAATWTKLKEDWRHFNIDLFPKVLYCRGSLVELLISSQVSRYLEFRAVSRIVTHMNGMLRDVPSSRADVFNSQIVNIIEKRMLMKFLTFCMDFEDHLDEYEDFKDKPFVEFLKFKKLTLNLQHFILYALAMKTEQSTTLEALTSIREYLRSIGRYGNSPFLWPLYGTAELPQAFCRLCAVFGGIYILKKTADKLIIDSENRFQGIVSEGKRLNAKWLLAGPSYIGGIEGIHSETVRKVSRGIFVTNKSIKPCDDEKVTLLTVPPSVSAIPGVVRALELGPLSFACPKNSHVVHLTCSSHQSQSAKDTLLTTAEALFGSDEEEDKPRVFWRLFFSQTDIRLRDETGLPANVIATSEPDAELGFHQAITKARSIFDVICPGEEILPAPPDPDDVVYVEEESHSNPGDKETEGEKDKEGEKEEKDKEPAKDDEKTEQQNEV